MKEVVKAIENSMVDINNVNTDKYYGVMLYDGSAGQIIGNDLALTNNTFEAKFFAHSTDGNPWTSKYSSLKDCIKSILNESSMNKVFEFDTYQELFKWASTT